MSIISANSEHTLSDKSLNDSYERIGNNQNKSPSSRSISFLEEMDRPSPRSLSPKLKKAHSLNISDLSFESDQEIEIQVNDVEKARRITEEQLQDCRKIAKQYLKELSSSEEGLVQKFIKSQSSLKSLEKSTQSETTAQEQEEKIKNQARRISDLQKQVKMSQRENAELFEESQELKIKVMCLQSGSTILQKQTQKAQKLVSTLTNNHSKYVQESQKKLEDLLFKYTQHIEFYEHQLHTQKQQHCEKEERLQSIWDKCISHMEKNDQEMTDMMDNMIAQQKCKDVSEVQKRELQNTLEHHSNVMDMLKEQLLQEKQDNLDLKEKLNITQQSEQILLDVKDSLESEMNQEMENHELIIEDLHKGYDVYFSEQKLKISKLQEEKETMEENLQKAQEKLQEMNEIDAMRIEELNVNKMDMEEMKQTILKYEQENLYKDTLCQDLRMEVEELEVFSEEIIFNLEKKAKEYNTLDETLQELTKQHLMNTEQLAQKDETISHLNEQNALQQDQIKYMDDENYWIKEEIKILETSKIVIENNSEEALKKVQIEKEMAEVRNQDKITEMTAVIDKLEHEVKDYREQLDFMAEQQKEYEQKEDENDLVLRQRQEDMQDKDTMLAKLKEDKEYLQVQIDGLNDLLDEENRSKYELNLQIEVLKSEIQDLSDTFKAQFSELDQEKEEMIMEQREDKNRILQIKDREIEKLMEENEELRDMEIEYYRKQMELNADMIVQQKDFDYVVDQLIEKNDRQKKIIENLEEQLEILDLELQDKGVYYQQLERILQDSKKGENNLKSQLLEFFQENQTLEKELNNQKNEQKVSQTEEKSTQKEEKEQEEQKYKIQIHAIDLLDQIKDEMYSEEEIEKKFDSQIETAIKQTNTEEDLLELNHVDDDQFEDYFQEDQDNSDYEEEEEEEEECGNEIMDYVQGQVQDDLMLMVDREVEKYGEDEEEDIKEDEDYYEDNYL